LAPPAFALLPALDEPPFPFAAGLWKRGFALCVVAELGAFTFSSSAASAANAAIDHVHDWILGTNGKWVTMGIASHGDYEIPAEVIYGFPVTCANGEYTLIKGLEIDSFSRERMTLTLNELLEEQAGVKHLLS
jgi:malate/lactate dehydrogenase